MTVSQPWGLFVSYLTSTDEEMPDAAETQPETTPAATATADTPEPTESETAVTVTNGRRRGRRRVMKKKKVKDEEGYLGEWLFA